MVISAVVLLQQYIMGGFIEVTMLNYMQGGADTVMTSVTRHQYS